MSPQAGNVNPDDHGADAEMTISEMQDKTGIFRDRVNAGEEIAITWSGRPLVVAVSMAKYRKYRALEREASKRKKRVA